MPAESQQYYLGSATTARRCLLMCADLCDGQRHLCVKFIMSRSPGQTGCTWPSSPLRTTSSGYGPFCRQRHSRLTDLIVIHKCQLVRQWRSNLSRWHRQRETKYARMALFIFDLFALQTQRKWVSFLRTSRPIRIHVVYNLHCTYMYT